VSPVHGDKLVDIPAKAKAVALGDDHTVPVASNGEAREPASDGEAYTPYTYKSNQPRTDHSHIAGLEDAEELE
jgi:hypothetical protein